jgi:hypothetical protein
MKWIRWETRAAAAFTLVLIAVRVWVARRVAFCGTPDSCYALGLAQALATKHAFRVPFLFDLQQHTLKVPNTGLEYWRPGMSLILLVLKPFGGVTLHGALVVTTLVGVVWALVAWQVAMRATGSRTVALASYALCLLLPPGWENSLAPEPTLLYAAAVAWFLALFTVRRQGLAQDVLALACAGAAYLIRNDAGLLLVSLVVVLWLRRRQGSGIRDQGGGKGPETSGLYAAAMIGGFFLALVPMHLLYLHVLGTAFPHGASEALFVNDLSDFSNYGVPVSLHTMLAYGVKHLIAIRVRAAAVIVYRVLVLMLGYAALVFLPSVAIKRPRTAGEDLPDAERMPELAGAVAFGAALLVVYSLVMPAIGVFSALRSSTALLPVVSVVVLVGIARGARTRRGAIVLAGTVLVLYTVSGLIDDRQTIGPMNAFGRADRAEAQGLAAMGARPEAGTVVMTTDPVQFSVTTGYIAIPMPGNGLDAITKEALGLHASHAILNGEHLPGSLNAIAEKLHPSRTENVPGQNVLLLELDPKRQPK